MGGIFGKGGQKHIPIANGLRITSAVYGRAIPLVIGTARVSPLLIWTDHFTPHTVDSGKKGSKKGGGGASITTYTVDVNYLTGYGPQEGIGAVYKDKDYYLGSVELVGLVNVSAGTTHNFVVPNVFAGQLVGVIGVEVDQPYSFSYNDYGASGPVSGSGVTSLPVHNAAFPAPNNGNWPAAPQIPYAFYNLQSPLVDPNIQIHFPTSQNCSARAYVLYANTSKNSVFSSIPVPDTILDYNNMAFELENSKGGNKEFSGILGTGIDMGSANILPGFSFEVHGLYAYGRYGRCSPADIFIDLITSGNNLQHFDPSFIDNGIQPFPVWNHGIGLSAYSLHIGDFVGKNPAYSKFGGILYDEPRLWAMGSGSAFSTYVNVAGNTSYGLLDVRNFCQSYGLFLGGVRDFKEYCAQFFEDILEITATAACWDGCGLKMIPRCEASNFGNGVSFVSPTASGPIADLTDNNFLTSAYNPAAGDKPEPIPPVTLTRGRPDASRNFNSLSIEFTDQSNMYNPGSITVVDAADIIRQGPMPGTQRSYKWINDAATANNVGWMILRRELTVVQAGLYTFRLPANWGMLCLMDLVTIYDPALRQTSIPVRIQKIVEHPDFTMDIEAEPFIYGAHTPTPPDSSSTINPPTGNPIPTNVDPGSVNAPAFIETTPALEPSGPKIWIPLSGSAQYYGGCTIWMSTDGGTTYQAMGRQTGRAATGVVYSSNYPTHVDPDATNTLNVNLVASLGTLTSFTTAQRDLFDSACYLEGGGTAVVNGQTLTIPYEIIAYATANLAGTNLY